MKKRHFLFPAAALAAACFLAACGWDSSGRNESWSNVAINVSGSYHGTDGYGGAAVRGLPGRAVTYLSVQQNGTAVTITDNLGGRYAGKISSTHKTAKGSGSSAVIQYSLNFEVSGSDSQGQATRLVGTFEAVAEGQLLHDRVMSGSWIGSAKNATIYGVAASVTDSQLVNSGITGGGQGGSSSGSSTNAASSKVLHWTSTNWPSAYHPSVDAAGNFSLTVPTQPGTNWYCRLRIDGGSGKYKWSSKRMAGTKPNYSMKPWDSSNKDWMFFPGTKEGKVRITVKDKITTREIYADITIVDDLANVE